MTALSFTVTDAGRAEIINANNTGTGPVTITHIALGSGQYTPAKAQTSLQQEFKRLSVFGGEVVADDVIHVTITDDGPDQYTLGEFGLVSDKGTLIALYAQTTPILEKNAEGIVLLSADMTLTSIDANSITFGPAEFVYPPASLTRAGVVVLSNAVNSTSQTQAATPQAVKTVNDALENHKAADSAHTKGQVGLAFVENWSWSHSYTDATGGATKYASGKAVADAYNALNSSKLNASSYTAADVLAKLKTVDGAASGLDADLFDGVQRTDMEAALKAYTDTKVAGLVDAAPGTLDTLNELAAALGDDPNFATTMTNELAKKLNAASYTASDVLAKLKTVHGAGSGIDADTVDGYQGYQVGYAGPGAGSKIHGDCAEFTQASGDTVLNPDADWYSGIRFLHSNDAGFFTQIVFPFHSEDLSWRRMIGGFDQGWRRIWHSGNQGANSGLDADKLDGKHGTYYAPAGAVAAFAMITPPDGWLKANGADVSRSAYAALFAEIGTTFGAGDGSTTFNLPDLRGEFLRGWDDGRGVDAGRGIGSTQSHAIQRHTHSLAVVRGNDLNWGPPPEFNPVGTDDYTDTQFAPAGYIGETGSEETRPRNIALLYCIKY